MRVTTAHPHTPPASTPATEPTRTTQAAAGRRGTPTQTAGPDQPARPPQRRARRRRANPVPGLPETVGAALAAAVPVLVVVLVSGLLLAGADPALAHAAQPTVSVVLAQGQTSGQVEQLIARATAWLTGLLASLATLFLVVGAVRYLCANGNTSEIEHAKQALRSAGIGYALAALAPLIVSILAELVGR